jgi:hypothetical protein
VILTPALESVSGHLQAPTALHGGEKASVSTEVPMNKFVSTRHQAAALCNEHAFCSSR